MRWLDWREFEPNGSYEFYWLPPAGGIRDGLKNGCRDNNAILRSARNFFLASRRRQFNMEGARLQKPQDVVVARASSSQKRNQNTTPKNQYANSTSISHRFNRLGVVLCACAGDACHDDLFYKPEFECSNRIQGIHLVVRICVRCRIACVLQQGDPRAKSVASPIQCRLLVARNSTP